MMAAHIDFPLFADEQERDSYLDRLLANGYQVVPAEKSIHAAPPELIQGLTGHATVETFTGTVYTVKDIDRRRGR